MITSAANNFEASFDSNGMLHVDGLLMGNQILKVKFAVEPSTRICCYSR